MTGYDSKKKIKKFSLGWIYAMDHVLKNNPSNKSEEKTGKNK